MAFQNYDPAAELADAAWKHMRDGEQLPARRYYSINENGITERNRTGDSPTRSRHEANSSSIDLGMASNPRAGLSFEETTNKWHVQQRRTR
jgi:hypothetical protein